MRTSSVLILWLGCLLAGAVHAADRSLAVGLWETIDDKTGQARSHVRILEVNGTYEGRVEKILARQPDDDPDNLCRRCEGARKDKPVLGMTVVWGLKREGSEYRGGEALDPKNGKVYRFKMKLLEGGARMEVRGYIGVSLLGRTQTWNRLE